MTRCKVSGKSDVQKKWYDVFVKKTTLKWMEEKREVDDTGGLWRIYDNLYDVSSFIDKHPGGRFWLEETKGLDITEAFETHHIKSDLPELTLKKFFVKKASKPRVAKYTFHESGFYKTVKKRVRAVLKTLPEDLHKVSDMYTDLLFLATFVFACLANALSVYTFAILASISCGLLLVATHNYIHQRDNFRMYYSDCFLMSTGITRIVHVLSHHAFSNSSVDLQLIFSLPFVNLYPQKKSIIVKYLAWLISTAFIFPVTLHVVGVMSILYNLGQKKQYKDQLLPLILPIAMYCTSGNTFLSTIGMWNIILLMSGTIFSTIAFTTSHIHPDLYIEGDATRPKDELDWGISQLDTVYDRKEIIGNQFFTLVAFGDHALHHLFPSLDHSYLVHLYPVLEETLKEFNIKSINITTAADLYWGFFKQAAREVPKLIPPSLEKVY